MKMMDFQQLIEISMRRPLTEAELEVVKAHLAANPQVREFWQQEESLNAALRRLPVIEPASNFTAVVLQQVRSEKPGRSSTRWFSIRGFSRKLAFAAVVFGTGSIFYYQHQLAERAAVAQSLVAVSDVNSILKAQSKKRTQVSNTSEPTVAALQDFDAIRSLRTVSVDLDLSLLKALE